MFLLLLQYLFVRWLCQHRTIVLRASTKVGLVNNQQVDGILEQLFVLFFDFRAAQVLQRQAHDQFLMVALGI